MKDGKIALLIIAGLSGLFFARTPQFLGDETLVAAAVVISSVFVLAFGITALSNRIKLRLREKKNTAPRR